MSRSQELPNPHRTNGLTGWYVLLGILLSCAAVSTAADPSQYGLSLQPHPVAGVADLGAPSAFSIQLSLDDGSAETVFGFAGGTARQFLWFNRFAHPGAFTLEEIQVLFPAGMDVPVDGAVQLAVYLDPDGDPTNGAQLLATYDDVIQFVDGSAFSVYPIDPPLAVGLGGDVLIGVVNRYFMTGMDPPPTFPAALDSTSSQDRSYFALWAADPPDPPDLATAGVIDVLDGASAGNFLIRGLGNQVPTIPTLGGVGLALLIGLLAAVGIVLTRRMGLL